MAIPLWICADTLLINRWYLKSYYLKAMAREGAQKGKCGYRKCGNLGWHYGEYGFRCSKHKPAI
ncbi:MAG: hypothetical protein Greene07147_359 [Parcubacteria group bacterium Greene0714_7]|nr:MAG: hypothetical protein Greene07147_359 [Parcubacteria group bacterium Greene0714_7]